MTGCGEAAPERTDGSAAPLGSGLLFHVHRFGIAERTRGFDLDGACVATDDCVDNRLHRLGLANTELQAIVDSSPTLLLLELAGVDSTEADEPDQVTVRTYLAEPLGEGRHRIAALSRRGEEARSQAPATLRAGSLRARPEHSLELFVGADAEASAYRLAFRLALAGIEASLSEDQALLQQGLIGGVLTIRELASRPNPFCGHYEPFCRRSDQTMLDLVASAEIPDIDMAPANGLERVEVDRGTGRVSRCLDGRGQPLAPSSEVEPWTCAEHDELRDGYSVSIVFEGRRFEGALE